MYRILCDSYVLYDPRLPDLFVIEPELTQKKNEPGELSFTIPKEHPNYGVLEKLKSRIKIYRDDTLIWLGRAIEDDRDVYENRKVVAEGALSFLLDSVLRQFTFDGTATELFAWILAAHNARVNENQRLTLGNCDISGSVGVTTKDYLSSWQALKTCLIDSFGGYLIVRYDENENPILDYLSDVPDTATQRIEFGENLIDLALNRSASETYTACVPLGAVLRDIDPELESDARLTIASVNDGQDFLIDSALADEYGVIFAPIGSTTWDEISDASILMNQGSDWLSGTGTRFKQTSSVYNRIGRGFAISRIPYRDEYITQYQEPYDTAMGYQYLMILTDNASTESEAYGECTVTHNSDGTKQITLAFTANCTYSASIGSANGSVVLSLPAIPRITTPTVSAVTLGSAATITLTPASSAFLHTLRAKFGSRAETTIASQTAATNISWTPSLDEANAAPNATSVVGTLYCDTYSGGVLLGTTQVSVTAAIPTSVVPTGSIWYSEAEEGLFAQFGCYVQRKSKLSLSISAAGVYGSSVSSISTTVNGATYSGNSFSTNELTTAGTNTIRTTITDSRGRTTVLTGTFEVVAYDSPSVQSVAVFRCDAAGNASNTGTYAIVAVTGVISSVSSKNIRTLKIGFKRKSESVYTETTFALSTYAVNGSFRIGGSLSNQYTYDIRVTLGDYFGEAYGYTDLSTAEVILSVRSTGMGLAVGKVAEEDSFDVGWPARFRENVQFDDAVTFSSALWLANLIFPVGSIRMTVSAADESAFLGGTWVRWGTGRVPVGVNTSDTNFNTVEKTGGANTHTLVTAELPSHNHSFSGSVTVNANGAHTHQASSGSYKVGSGSASTYYYMTNGGSTSGQTTGSGGSHDHTGSVSGSVGNNGSGAAHNNLQPYITCYFWKRTS